MSGTYSQMVQLKKDPEYCIPYLEVLGKVWDRFKFFKSLKSYF